jgi:hypothetical protein
VIAEILVFLHGHQQDEELYYLEHKDKVPARTTYALSPEDHEKYITHPFERGPVRAMMEVLGIELPKAFTVDLAKYQLGKEDRHGPKSDLPLRRVADNDLLRVLGPGQLGYPVYELCLTKRQDVGFVLECANRPR